MRYIQYRLMKIKQLLGFSLCLFSGVVMAEDLVLYNWNEYMDPEILTAFTAETGITVKEIYYETDETKNRLLVSTGGEGIDLMVTSGVSLAAYIDAGWVQKIDQGAIPNLNNIAPRWKNIHGNVVSHGVPMLWGTLGIAYRADKIQYPVRSWQALFKPNPILHNRIMMIDDSRDTIGMALKALRYSANSEDKDEILSAGELLKKQRPFVRSYSYLNLGDDSEMVNGVIWMAMAYSGDALILQQSNPNIHYVVPEEGGNLWVDYIAVTTKSHHKTEAHQFINFLLKPEQSAKLASYTQYGSANVKASSYLGEKHLNNTIIYPGRAEMDKSEIHHTLSAKALRLRNRIYSEVVQ